MKTYALRLKPGQDLKKELVKFTIDNKIKSGFIITCVGSLRKANLRLADEEKSKIFKQKFEIVSLVGTLSQYSPHLHISLSDKKGKNNWWSLKRWKHHLHHSRDCDWDRKIYFF